MGLIYIRFKTDKVVPDSEQQGSERWLTRSIENILIKVTSSIVPKANPDFDGKIQDVRQWILEVDDDEGIPEREIGLDDKGNVMMIMPWKDNYGFWTDSNVHVDELAKSHEMQFLDRQEFENLWNDFEKKNRTR